MTTSKSIDSRAGSSNWPAIPIPRGCSAAIDKEKLSALDFKRCFGPAPAKCRQGLSAPGKAMLNQPRRPRPLPNLPIVIEPCSCRQKVRAPIFDILDPPRGRPRLCAGGSRRAWIVAIDEAPHDRFRRTSCAPAQAAPHRPVRPGARLEPIASPPTMRDGRLAPWRPRAKSGDEIARTA